jgi:integrator complex subunit 7
MATCRKISREFDKLPLEVGGKTITNRHTDVVLKQIEMAIKSPICIPRFFFQVQQNTSIKLSMSPFPRVSGEAIVVQSGHNLVVKVEGVIQNSGAKPSLYRSIESVQLTLTSQLLTPRSVDLKPMNDTITLVQTTKPSRDFLSANFLLSLNQNGTNGQQWQVTLESCIVDDNGVIWNTLGPKK